MDKTGSLTSARCGVVLCLAGLALSGWVLAIADPAQRLAQRPAVDLTPRQHAAEGLENLWELPLPNGSALYCGGQPVGEAGFASLEQLGVRTVISVDGAQPELHPAGQHGLRYVHLPIGYDDVPADQVLRMVQAVQAFPGPVYVHCHHGKHRGPAAAVCVWRQLTPAITAEQAVAVIRKLGTAPKYRGLYQSVARPIAASPSSRIDPSQLPSSADVPPLVTQMVQIDHTWETLQSLARRDELAAAEQRDADLAWTHLKEQFHEAARLYQPGTVEGERQLQQELAAAASRLESLNRGEGEHDELRWLQSLLPQVQAQCVDCHAAHRD